MTGPKQPGDEWRSTSPFSALQRGGESFGLAFCPWLRLGLIASELTAVQNLLGIRVGGAHRHAVLEHLHYLWPQYPVQLVQNNAKPLFDKKAHKAVDSENQMVCNLKRSRRNTSRQLLEGMLCWGEEGQLLSPF